MAKTEGDEFDELMKETLQDFKEHDDVYSGYVDSEQSFQELMFSIKALGHSYSIRGTNKPNKKGKKVLADRIELKLQHTSKDARSIDFFGSPFTIIASTVFQCSQGPKYYRKRTQSQCTELSNNVDPSKKRHRSFDTKKLNCPAFIRIRTIRYYPDFVVAAPQKRSSRTTTKKMLNDALASDDPPTSILRYYMTASRGSSHTHSLQSAQITQAIHPDLVKEIHRLVHCGLTTPKLVKPMLDQFVEEKFKNLKIKPSQLNAAFYPSNKNMHFHVRKAVLGLQKESGTDGKVVVIHMPDFNDVAKETVVQTDWEKGESEVREVVMPECWSDGNVQHVNIPTATEEELEAVRLTINEQLNNLNNLTYQCFDMNILQTIEKDVRDAIDKAARLEELRVAALEEQVAMVTIIEGSEISSRPKSEPNRVRKRLRKSVKGSYKSVSRIGKCVELEGPISYVDKRTK